MTRRNGNVEHRLRRYTTQFGPMAGYICKCLAWPPVGEVMQDANGALRKAFRKHLADVGAVDTEAKS